MHNYHLYSLPNISIYKYRAKSMIPNKCLANSHPESTRISPPRIFRCVFTSLIHKNADCSELANSMLLRIFSLQYQREVSTKQKINSKSQYLLILATNFCHKFVLNCKKIKQQNLIYYDFMRNDHILLQFIRV